jgi:hypothetical protein
MTEKETKELARYIAEFLREEFERGNNEMDEWTIWNAIEAWKGGAR